MALILLADDSPHARRMGEQILQGDGHSVASVADRDAALQYWESTRTDLAIIDISLPGGSVALCQNLTLPGRNCPIILSAGATEQVSEGTVAEARGWALLRKPFEASVMLDCVNEVLNRAAQQNAGLGWTAERVREAVRKELEIEIPRLTEAITARVIADIKKH